jgi:hypothetical protein
MLESLLLALVGGVIGGVLAYLAFNNFHTSTMNFQSFSQITFAFRVTPQLLVRGIIWAGGDWFDWRFVPGHPRRPPIAAHRGGVYFLRECCEITPPTGKVAGWPRCTELSKTVPSISVPV